MVPYGLTEFDVHDVINVFQVTGLMPEDRRYFMKACPAKVGDYFELFCETDLLMAGSTCPGGDLAAPLWGPGADVEPNCNPILVEVYTVAAELLDGSEPLGPRSVRGSQGARHGLAAPAGVPPPFTQAPFAQRTELDPGQG